MAKTAETAIRENLVQRVDLVETASTMMKAGGTGRTWHHAEELPMQRRTTLQAERHQAVRRELASRGMHVVQAPTSYVAETPRVYRGPYTRADMLLFAGDLWLDSYAVDSYEAVLLAALSS